MKLQHLIGFLQSLFDVHFPFQIIRGIDDEICYSLRVIYILILFVEKSVTASKGDFSTHVHVMLRSLLFTHCSILSRSSCVSQYGFLIAGTSKLSAKLNVSEKFRTSSRFFVDLQNLNGPKMDPWGTTPETSRVLELQLLNDKNCWWFPRWLIGISSRHPPTPIGETFWTSSQWGTWSKT